MTTMIALVGEQPLPNFLPVRYYQPKDVLFIYTTKTKQKYEHLKATLQSLASSNSQEIQGVNPSDNRCNIYGLETDPFDISSVARAIEETLAKLAEKISQPLEFNLTGGTKAMMLAAYQVAARLDADVFYLQSEGVQSTIYRYSWRNGQLDLQSQEHLPRCINLRDVLNLHLGQRKWEEKDPNMNDPGSMFELAIAQALRDHGYETMCEVKNSAMDIDVMIGYQNQVGVIEAKAFENKLNFESIGQLSKIVRYLGTYTKQFFVLNKQLNDSQKSILEALRITPISLLRYCRGDSTLATEDRETLLREIDSKMKAGS